MSDVPDGSFGDRRVMNLLERQFKLYDQLEQLADVQRDLIEQDDAQPLLRLLTQRQKLTTALTGLDAELAPYRARWSEVTEGLPPAERQALNEQIREAEARLRRILARDDADGRRLAARKMRAAENMSELETARRTLVAYGGAAGGAGGARLLDGTEA
ncbi:MAG: flagellar protein FlgN [bacterium]|nr:flagellar protein FlgN [bacterium]